MLSVNRPVAPEGSDAWSRRYIQKTKSPAGTPRKQRVNDNNEDATPKRDTSSNPYADLQRKLSKKANHLNIPAMSPRLEDQVEETITRAFGSVLDPKSSRSKWACAICHAMFLRVGLIQSRAARRALSMVQNRMWRMLTLPPLPA